MSSERISSSTSENVNQDQSPDRLLGAKVLTTSSFRDRHREIVDSSFEKLRHRKEKLVGKNGERRIDAYLERINRGVKKHGSKYEKRLWAKTRDSLIVDPQNIPESYWRTQEQILRDNGQGRELSDAEKDYLAQDIQNKQRESIDSWVNYLSHEDCPYPLWFKIYAIDGVSKMGVFDSESGTYRKRDKSSVAPYPHLNPAVLGKVYAAVADFYGIDSNKDLGLNQDNPAITATDDGTEAERDAELGNLVKSGNFNRLYSRLLLSEKVIMPTPERTEDVRGKWVEYKPGDEEGVAKAADGTPWCVASPSVARSYLTTGSYGEVYEDSNDDSNQARFILFQLYDDDDRLAENACASIRLDTDGNVAEISGLGEGQALEDSLVPIVEAKVKTLPGGEKFLKRFADKKRLIEIDRKMQSGAEITREDFRFIWELDRPIETLDTYNNEDPRITEFRKKYDAKYAAEMGYIIPDTTIADIEGNLEKYLGNDLGLASNLLVYVLKKQLKTTPENVRRAFGSSSIRKKLAELGTDYVQAMVERVRSLEIFETENYAFMLPRDQWSKRIDLPNDPENRSLAPSDLTAILKHSVSYNYDQESDGRSSWGTSDVYDESWVGREIRHFPWSKELFEAEDKLLKPHGYSIPKSWRPIVDGLKQQIATEKGIDQDEVSGRELSSALREKLGLTFAGWLFAGRRRRVGGYGCFWSASEESAKLACCLDFGSSLVLPGYYEDRAYAQSVRCVAESGSFPNS